MQEYCNLLHLPWIYMYYSFDISQFSMHNITQS
jgi:hypothetical protein